MQAVRALAAVTAVLVLIPGAVVARSAPARSALAARAAAGMPDSGRRELSCIDVSSEDDRSRGALPTWTPAGGWSTDYRPPDPLPVFRWATRGEWRRHRAVPPTGSAATPLI